MKNLILLLSALSLILTACGDDGKSNTTTTNNNETSSKAFPTHEDIDECNDLYTNRYVTTASGNGVYVGVPGNIDCPYKKAVRKDLFVEAYTHKVKSRDFLQIGNNGISGQIYCNFNGCWSLKQQCPTGFRRVEYNNQQPIFNAYIYGYINPGPYSHYGYSNQQRNVKSKYDDLPRDKVWCEPTYGSRWYDDWVYKNGSDFGDDYGL